VVLDGPAMIEVVVEAGEQAVAIEPLGERGGRRSQNQIAALTVSPLPRVIWPRRIARRGMAGRCPTA
jgi:hypothetical protein